MWKLIIRKLLSLYHSARLMPNNCISLLTVQQLKSCWHLKCSSSSLNWRAAVLSYVIIWLKTVASRKWAQIKAIAVIVIMLVNVIHICKSKACSSVCIRKNTKPCNGNTQGIYNAKSMGNCRLWRIHNDIVTGATGLTLRARTGKVSTGLLTTPCNYRNKPEPQNKTFQVI